MICNKFSIGDAHDNSVEHFINVTHAKYSKFMVERIGDRFQVSVVLPPFDKTRYQPEHPYDSSWNFKGMEDMLTPDKVFTLKGLKAETKGVPDGTVESANVENVSGTREKKQRGRGRGKAGRLGGKA